MEIEWYDDMGLYSMQKFLAEGQVPFVTAELGPERSECNRSRVFEFMYSLRYNLVIHETVFASARAAIRQCVPEWRRCTEATFVLREPTVAAYHAWPHRVPIGDHDTEHLDRVRWHAVSVRDTNSTVLRAWLETPRNRFRSAALAVVSGSVTTLVALPPWLHPRTVTVDLG